MTTLGFILSIDELERYYTRALEIERTSGRALTKEERQNLLLDMVQRHEADAFAVDACPELVERRLLESGNVGYIQVNKKPSSTWRGVEDGKNSEQTEGA